MDKHDEGSYLVSDFNIVCILMNFRFELVDEYWDQKRKTWCFKRDSRMDQILKQYWQRNLSVNVAEFLAVQDQMKTSLTHNR
jgi:hypothetical protein